jgi:hypothetical protein
MLSGGGGKLIIDLPTNSTHVVTLKNPAMVVAQVLQLNRELARGNSHVVGAIAGRIKNNGSGGAPEAIALGTSRRTAKR